MKCLSSRLGGSVLACLTGAAMLAVCAARADEKLTMSYPGAPTGIWGQLSQKMSDDARERGQAIEIFPQNELGGSAQAVEGILTNVIDIAFLSGYRLADRVQGFELLNFPLLAANLSEAKQIIAAVGPDLAQRADRSGLKVLGYTWLVGTFISAEKCVVHPADLDGAKVIDGPRYHQMFVKSIGGVPVALAAAEYYTAMQTGISRTGLFSIPLILKTNLHETTDCITDPTDVAVMLLPVVLVMNTQSFDHQTEEVKLTLGEIAKAAEADAEERIHTLIGEAVKNYTGNGKSSEKISGEALGAWRKAADVLNAKLAKELNLDDLYAKALSARNEKKN